MLAQEEAAVLGQAARGYEAVIVADATVLEADLRLGRVQARQGRLEAAAARQRGLAGDRRGPIRDARQAYLAALFLADVNERRGRRAEAVAQYERRGGPGLRRRRRSSAWRGCGRWTARTARRAPRCACSRRQRPAHRVDRSDPWHGYDAGQAWRLPAAIAALQASFETMP